MSPQPHDPVTGPGGGPGSVGVAAGPAAPEPIPPPPGCVPDPDAERPNPAADAFHRITGGVSELKEYAGYYLTAKVDGFRQTLKKIGLYAALGLVGLIVAGAIVATAAGLLVAGLAELLGHLFGDRLWLGNLVVGVLVLAAVGLGVWIMMNKLTGTWRSQTIRKYEQRKQSQRERFDGHDVTGRAGQAATVAAPTPSTGPGKPRRS